MACASRSMISASSCAFASQSQQRTTLGKNLCKPKRAKSRPFSIFASSDDPDCNVEECAPDKEVGKVSMEWLAGEKTKVVGTYPPRRQGWTGYVEKDTAGQTNIYSVEPVVYVAESAISSGSAGTSPKGSQNTAVIVAGVTLVTIAAASVILLQLSKDTPQVQSSSDYSGPPLSYYINKFKPSNTIDASVPPESRSAPTVEASVPLEPQNPPELKSESSEVVLSGVEEELELVGTQS